MKEVKKFRFIPILLAVILAVFLLLSSVTTIPAGHTGVVTTFGKVSGTVLGEGLHFKLPFITNVVKIDNRVLKTEVSSSSASKDLQTVNSTIALNYRIGRANSASICLLYTSPIAITSTSIMEKTIRLRLLGCFRDDKFSTFVSLPCVSPVCVMVTSSII